MPDRTISVAKGLIRHSRELVWHQREIERATGAHFNLFQIFGVGHYEVSTHSPLLGDLLNPKGTHGQGPVFLKCFIKTLTDAHLLASQEPLRSFDADSAQVRLEHSLGARTETGGGRLDIFITDKAERQIAIENKIYAAEQENWVRRYRNGLREDACLIYLTLNGDDPFQIVEEDREKVVCISYARTILQWLTACRKEVATVPIVRESLTQYIHLIQELTHQNPDSRMNDEIMKSVLESEENFDAFCTLRNADSAIRGKVIRDLAERIRGRIPTEFEIVSTPDGNGAKGEAFSFTTPELKKSKLTAAIEFDARDYRNCYFGFATLDPNAPFEETSSVRQLIHQCFTRRFGAAVSTGYWPAWQWWPKPQWDDEVFREILFKQDRFDAEFIEKIENLHAVATDFQKEFSRRGNETEAS